MPYIKQALRDHFLDDQIENGRAYPEVAGELNYLITCLIIDYVHDNGLSYQTCNDIVGALDNAKHEFQRRVQDPYEDLKSKENGDVYPASVIAEVNSDGEPD